MQGRRGARGIPVFRLPWNRLLSNLTIELSPCRVRNPCCKRAVRPHGSAESGRSRSGQFGKNDKQQEHDYQTGEEETDMHASPPDGRDFALETGDFGFAGMVAMPLAACSRNGKGLNPFEACGFKFIRNGKNVKGGAGHGVAWVSDGASEYKAERSKIQQARPPQDPHPLTATPALPRPAVPGPRAAPRPRRRSADSSAPRRTSQTAPTGRPRPAPSARTPSVPRPQE